MTPTLVLLTEESVQHRTGYAQAIQGLIAELLLDPACAVVDTTLPGSLDRQDAARDPPGTATGAPCPLDTQNVGVKA